MTIDFGRIPRGFRNETNIAKRSGVYMGLVRKNFDAQRMGRLLVWISDFGPDNEDFWIPVSYASPFAGATPVAETKKDGLTMEDSQQSYGFWATPPDRDNQVLCCFLDGDIANGFWFACIYPQNMNHMIPGLGFDFPSTDPTMDQAFSPLGPPVVEYNKYDTKNAPNGHYNFDKEKVKRPVFTPLAEGLKTQGLAKDPKRGPSNTSARRESPSRVMGLLSPRGHSLSIDDGALGQEGDEPECEFIRFRTRSGAQVLINETDGFIYLITKGGKSWVEISDEGIDMFSAESISLNAEKDVNISAGGRVGIHANQSINMATAFLSTFTSGKTSVVAGDDLLMDCAKNIGLKSSKDVMFDAVRDVTSNAGRNILEGACGYASRNAVSIKDNSGGAAPPDVDHAGYERNVVNRVPTHEPWDRGGKGTGSPITGVDASGHAVTQVRRSDGSLAQVPVDIPKSMQARAKLLYAKLKARGFTDVQASVILGCWMQESSLNPGAQEPGGGHGIGLGQWSYDMKNGQKVGEGRRGKLLEYAKSKGKNWQDTDLQLDFFQMELAGSEAKAGRMLKSATTVSEGLAAMKQFERFGIAGQRESYAQQVYNDVKSGKLA